MPGFYDDDDDLVGNTQAYQEESLCITFDDPNEARAREEIQQMLGGGGGGAATGQSPMKGRPKTRRIPQEEEEGVQTVEGEVGSATRSSKRTRRSR